MPLIILDRDGVINYDSIEYIKSPEELIFIPGSLKAISMLNQAGYTVVIATNQSGLARGLFDLATLEKIHAKLTHELAKENGHIADIYFCPHHPNDGCDCRKPKTGLFLQIQKKYPVDFSQVFFVGDSKSDIEVAQAVGCKPLLVLTGNGQTTLTTYSEKCSSSQVVSDTADCPSSKIGETSGTRFQEGINFPYCRDLAHAAEFVINAK